MDNPYDILDAPLETRVNAAKPYPYPTINKLDFGVNVFLLGVGVLILSLGFYNNDIVIIFLLWNLPLGGYQLLSALIGAIRGNKGKLVYLLSAVVYLALLFVLADVFSQDINASNEKLFAWVFLIALPYIGAAIYTKLCYDAKKQSQVYD